MNRVYAAMLALLVPVSLVPYPPSRVSAQPARPNAVTPWHRSLTSMAERHFAPDWSADAQEAHERLTVRQIYHRIWARLVASGKIYKALMQGKYFSIELYYAPANNLFGTPLLFTEQRPSSAPAPLPRPPAGSGWTRQTVKLANGHAVILSGRATMAFAYIGSISALIESTGSVRFSVPALQTVVRGLRPYVPHA